MSPQERLPVLAGAQLGEGSLTDYLAGKPVSDSAGVEIERWINSAKRRMSQVSPRTSPPPAPVLPNLRAVTQPIIEETLTVGPDGKVEARTQRRVLPSPVSKGPQVIPVPITPPSPQVPTATAVDQIDIVPSFDTSYAENFLTVYSKLIYQVV
jgi:hypothetical protein